MLFLDYRGLPRAAIEELIETLIDHLDAEDCATADMEPDADSEESGDNEIEPLPEKLFWKPTKVLRRAKRRPSDLARDVKEEFVRLIVEDAATLVRTPSDTSQCLCVHVAA